MKKLTTLLLTVLLAAALCLGAGAQAPAAAADYTGIWLLVSIETDDMLLTPATLGLHASLTLAADGTCVITAGEKEQTAAWNPTESGLTIANPDGTADAFTFTDGTLRIVREGMTLIYAPEGVTVTPPLTQPLCSLTLADFNGLWELTSIRVQDMVFSAGVMDVAMTIELLDGAGSCASETASHSGSVTLHCELAETANGTVLTATAANGDSTALPLTLHSDGMLYWSVTRDDILYTYCFVRQAPEAAEQ